MLNNYDNYFPVYIDSSEHPKPNELIKQMSEFECDECDESANTIKLKINPEFDYEKLKQLFDDILLPKCKLRVFESILREYEQLKRDKETLKTENERLNGNVKRIDQINIDLTRKLDEKDKKIGELIEKSKQIGQEINEINDSTRSSFIGLLRINEVNINY